MSAPETESAAWTVARLLAWTQDFLHRQRIDSPRLCAEILLAYAMKCERLHLYTRFEEAPADAARDAFRELVKQAAAGRPIAYLTGIKEFFALPFEVTPDVLIPRPETEILVERTISLIRKSPQPIGRILDLCTGSGCIAISLAKNLPNVTIAASDISEPALAVARRNAAKHGVAERIDFRAGDLFVPWNSSDGSTSVADSQPFDVIVCNPPYVALDDAALDANVRDFEPHLALLAGKDGLELIRPLVAQAPRLLRAGGHLLFEIAYNQSIATRALLDNPDWEGIVAYRDAGGHERVLHARRAS